MKDPEQLRAAGLLKQIFYRFDSTLIHPPPHAAHTFRINTNATLDRLLEFPSPTSCNGSLAPGKKNHPRYSRD